MYGKPQLYLSTIKLLTNVPFEINCSTRSPSATLKWKILNNGELKSEKEFELLVQIYEMDGKINRTIGNEVWTSYQIKEVNYILIVRTAIHFPGEVTFICEEEFKNPGSGEILSNYKAELKKHIECIF